MFFMIPPESLLKTIRLVFIFGPDPGQIRGEEYIDEIKCPAFKSDNILTSAITISLCLCTERFCAALHVFNVRPSTPAPYLYCHKLFIQQ